MYYYSTEDIHDFVLNLSPKFFIKNIDNVSNVFKKYGILDNICTSDVFDDEHQFIKININNNEYTAINIIDSGYIHYSLINLINKIDIDISTIFMLTKFENNIYEVYTKKYKKLNNFNFAFQDIKETIQSFIKDFCSAETIGIKLINGNNIDNHNFSKNDFVQKAEYLKNNCTLLYLTLLDSDFYNFEDEDQFNLYTELLKCVNKFKNINNNSSVFNVMSYMLYSLITSRWAFIPAKIIKVMAIEYIDLVLKGNIQSRSNTNKLKYSKHDDIFSLDDNVEYSDISNIYNVLLLSNIILVNNDLEPIRFIVSSYINNEFLLNNIMMIDPANVFYNCCAINIQDKNLDKLNKLIINMINDFGIYKFSTFSQKIIYSYFFVKTENSDKKFKELISELLKYSKNKNNDINELLSSLFELPTLYLSSEFNNLYISTLVDQIDFDKLTDDNISILIHNIINNTEKNSDILKSLIKRYVAKRFNASEFLNDKEQNMLVEIMLLHDRETCKILENKVSLKIKRIFNLYDANVFDQLTKINSPILARTMINLYLYNYILLKIAHYCNTPSDDEYEIFKRRIDDILETIYKSNNSFKLLLSKLLFGLCSTIKLNNNDFCKLYFEEVSNSLLDNNLKYLLLTGNMKMNNTQLPKSINGYSNPTLYGVTYLTRCLFGESITNIVNILGNIPNIDNDTAAYYTEQYLSTEL